MANKKKPPQVQVTYKKDEQYLYDDIIERGPTAFYKYLHKEYLKKQNNLKT